MEMYKAIKEIEKDLISRRYIKEPKDINLHLSSRFDQYCLTFNDELQEADIKRRIIRAVIDNRKATEMRKKFKANNKNKVINNENKATNNKLKKTKRKCKAKSGKDIFVIDFKKGNSRFYNSYKAVSKKFEINYQNLIKKYLKEEKYYMKQKGIVLIRCQEGDNKLLLENLDEVIKISREIYEKENKSKYVDKINPLEAVKLAEQIVEERLKNENR